jgi:DNA-binding transcriptional LysR family regulator
MSHALKRLRRLFDDELFLRTPVGMEPTAQALALINPIANMLDEMQVALQTESRFDPLTDSQLFKVGVTDYGSVIVLPEIIKQIRKISPHATIQAMHVAYTENYQALDERQIDLAIMSRLGKLDARFKELNLFTETPVCVVCEGHSRVRNKIDMDTYLSLDHISVAPGRSDKVWPDNTRKTGTLTRRIAMTVPHFSAALASLPGTDLIATLPSRIAESVSHQYQLKILPVPFNTEPLSIAQVWHRRDDKDPAHQWFRTVVSESLAAYR